MSDLLFIRLPKNLTDSLDQQTAKDKDFSLDEFSERGI